MYVGLLTTANASLRRNLLNLKRPGLLLKRSFSWQLPLRKVNLKWRPYYTGFLTYPIARGFLSKVSCQPHQQVKSSHKNTHHLKSHVSVFDWALFWSFIQPDFVFFLLAAVSAFAVSIVNIKTPMLIGELVNTISDLIRNAGENTVSELFTPCKRLVINYLLQSLLTFLYISLLSAFGERFACRLRIKLFAKLMHQDMFFYDEHKTGEIINRLSGDVQDFKSSFKQVISQGLRSGTQMLGCGLTLFALSPKLTSVMVLLLPGIILVGSGLGSLLRCISQKAQEQISMAMSVADEAVANIRTVRAFAMEHKEIGWYSSEVRKSQSMNETLGLGIAAFQALTNLAINGVVLVVLYTGAVLVDKKELSPGGLISYLITTQTLQKSLSSISILFGQVVRGMSAGARVFEFMRVQPMLTLYGGRSIPREEVRGHVSIRDVRFAYPARPEQIVFKDFCLEIPAGKVTAICGSSGAGKSTIAALLEHFYDVEKGVIEIDGVGVNELDSSWLRGELIGYINQEPTLFAASVKENIRYGSPHASDKQVFEAAKKANAHHFISEFPQGYNTVVGERGVTVSGGQKQRIAIARALLKDPKILILDEATSALDAESERQVQSALDTLIKGRTVIVIAHRLSTIQNADVIAAISNGKLVEIGGHKDLMAKNGYYAELVRKQLGDS